MRRLLPVLLLAGCGAAPDLPAAPGPLVLKDDGFGVGGTPLEIGFGRTEAGAISSAERLIGRPPSDVDSLGSCTFVEWRDGPVMVFRDGAFVGWLGDDRRAGNTCGRIS